MKVYGFCDNKCKEEVVPMSELESYLPKQESRNATNVLSAGQGTAIGTIGFNNEYKNAPVVTLAYKVASGVGSIRILSITNEGVELQFINENAENNMVMFNYQLSVIGY